MRLAPIVLTLWLALPAGPAAAQNVDDTVVQAREALNRKDSAQLAAARAAVNRAAHPLAQWVEYWELANRLPAAQQAELDSFYARWSGSYVEDRLRNDWLLELGKRRDWVNFRIEFPRFRMNDDREVTCYALLTQLLAGQDVREAARAAWYAQRESDDGCTLLAQTLREARLLSDGEVWQRVRRAVEAARPRLARTAAALIRPGLDASLNELMDDPLRFLQRHGEPKGTIGHELVLLALMRMAANDPEQAATQLEARWERALPAVHVATAWAHVGKQAAIKQSALAATHARRAWKQWDIAAPPGTAPPWSEDLKAWHARAGLRAAAADKQGWALLQRAVQSMDAAAPGDGAWVYWNARAQLARAPAGPEGDGQRGSARQALEAIASPMTFYGQLAVEELGQRLALPPAPAALTAEERVAALRLPGLERALRLFALGLRNEAVREWNFTLRGMGERELLAAAQLACDREVWDRCINTSERTRTEVNVAQRYPTPHRESIESKARLAGLEPAVVFGLIRQESRFIVDARSSAGASGLMQLMPDTARWTARQVGLAFTPQLINERDINLQLGTAYLKRVLDNLDGSLAMAAAAYNAGPGRPRRWREGPLAEAAAWAENIPFNETRDYVKKVLSNSVVYAAVLGQPVPTLKSRLGRPVGPRDARLATPEGDIP